MVLEHLKIGLIRQIFVQRKEPRLPGRRSRTSQSGGPAQSTVKRMISVPLPSSAIPEPQQAARQSATGDVPNLMDFDSYVVPSYSAPAGTLHGLGDDSRSQGDLLAVNCLNELSLHHQAQAVYLGL